MPLVKGAGLRRVDLPADSVRGGLLTQASILKVTANGANTSPVLRGAWLLERVIGTPAPPPPPNAGGIEPDTRGRDHHPRATRQASVREDVRRLSSKDRPTRLRARSVRPDRSLSRLLPASQSTASAPPPVRSKGLCDERFAVLCFILTGALTRRSGSWGSSVRIN